MSPDRHLAGRRRAQPSDVSTCSKAARTSDGGVEKRVRKVACPVKGQSTSGWESRPGKPPEEPGSEPPASGEIRASKRGVAKLQAVVITRTLPRRKNHP